MSDQVSKKVEKTLPRHRPATDIIETADGFHIIMDMPGATKQGLVIDLNKNEVAVRGETTYPAEPEQSKDRRYSHVEYGGAEYTRTFTLSDTVDREKITAKLENGVLDLFLPKAEAAQPKRIEISVG